jgi:tetratricopeptide (TPR) repeat protein
MHGEGGDVRRKALLEKNIGAALLNTGALTESIDHFDRTLQYLGEPVPRSRVAIYGRFAMDLLAVLSRLYLGARRRRRRISDTEREVFEVMFLRARALTTSDPRRLFIDNIGGARRLNRVDPTQVDGSCGLYAGVSALFAFTAFSFGVSARFLALAKPLIRTDNVRDEFVYGSFWFIHHYLQGQWGDEHAVGEALVDEALRGGQLWDVNTYVGLLCDRKLRQGDFGAARALVARLAEISDAYGYDFAAANHDAMTTLLLLEQRQLAEALEAAEAYAAARHEKPLKLLGLGSKAKAQVLLGDLSSAEATLAAAEDVLHEAPDTAPWHLSAYVAARLRWEACALESTRERSRAQRSAREALRVASKVAIQRAEIHQLCGRLDWLLGRRRQAERYWRAALKVGEQMGARPELARTYAEIGRSLSEVGGDATFDGLSAATCIERARTLFSELGLDWDRQQIAVPAVRAA